MSERESSQLEKVQGSSFIHLILVSLLGLPLVTPLLSITRVPCTHDGHLHYHRVAAMRHMWESGLLFSRWLPDVAFGYGYPFFIFREGPPLYLVLVPHLLGLPLPGAFNLFYIICILAGGWFMFLWVRDIFGTRPAFVSATAYMAAPYILIDAFIRGNQPESLALALFPLILWSGRRFVQQGGAAAFLGGTLALTLLALSHNISILLFSPFLLIYLLFCGWAQQISWKNILLRTSLLLGLGLALSAFYTVPALLELDQITISQSVTSRNNDFHFNFSNLGEIFSQIQSSDPSLLNPPLLFRLGWLPTILALCGLLSLVWARSRERRGHILFMALTAAVLIFMATPASLFLWENVPLIEYVQFPWRFVGRAALPVAFLAGVPFAYIPNRREWHGRQIPLTSLVTVTAVTLLIVESIPHLYPRTCGEDSFPTINTVHAYEHATGMVGVDPEGSYFPITVIARPTGSALEADYLANQVPNRFDESAFPPDTVYLESSYRPLSGRVTVEAPKSFDARYLTFYYPGWNAFVDGQEVPITPSDPEGLITFPVPAGNHTLEVSWLMTPSRTAAAAFSVAAGILILVVFIVLLRRNRLSKYAAAKPTPSASTPDLKRAAAQASSADSSAASVDRLTPALLAAAAISLLLAKLLIIDGGSTILRRESDPSVDAGSPVRAGEFLLEGYSLSSQEVPSGETFDVDLAWRALEPPQANYQSNLWLVGPDGMVWSDKETQRPRQYEEAIPSVHWQPGQWSWDSREVKVIEGTPPGQYDIVLILFDKETLAPLTFLTPDGQAIGPEVQIGSIDVVFPDSPSSPNPQTWLDEEIGGLLLLGFNLDRVEAAPGDSFLVTLFWERLQEGIKSPNSVTLALVDSSGEPAQQWDLPPVGTGQLPANWSVGFPYRGQHLLRIDPEVGSGQYTLQLQGLDLGEIVISDLERQFTAPEMEQKLSASLGDLAELVGATIEPEGVTLLWRALSESPTSYRVFVHLVDSNGAIIEQSDGIPAGWTRPTTGWLSGEYILDSHPLDLGNIPSDQEVSLRIGLYDPATGKRLPTSEGDFITVELPENTR